MDLSPPFIGTCNQQHVMDSKVSIHYTRDTDERTYHIRLSSHFIVRYSRDTDGLTDVLYIHDSCTILTVYVGLAQARPNKQVLTRNLILTMQSNQIFKVSKNTIGGSKLILWAFPLYFPQVISLNHHEYCIYVCSIPSL